MHNLGHAVGSVTRGHFDEIMDGPPIPTVQISNSECLHGAVFLTLTVTMMHPM